MYDVIVIGSGPAGYTAALYTSRAFLKTLLVAGNQPGGQLTTTTDVDNYPGFPKGIQGPQLIADMKAQIERFGTEILASEASRVSKASDGKTFTVTAGEKTYEAKTVIIAYDKTHKAEGALDLATETTSTEPTSDDNGAATKS